MLALSLGMALLSLPVVDMALHLCLASLPLALLFCDKYQKNCSILCSRYCRPISPNPSAGPPTLLLPRLNKLFSGTSSLPLYFCNYTMAITNSTTLSASNGCNNCLHSISKLSWLTRMKPF